MGKMPRYVVMKAKGFLGVVRWHVLDTRPDKDHGSSKMEADDKVSCDDYARELNTGEVDHE